MKNKIIALIFGIIILILLGFLFINAKNTSKPSGKIQVAASFYPMYFFASQIGGDKAQVFNITPAAAEPHDYEPTTQDVVRINQSQMLVLNGGKLEAWGDKIKDQLQGTRTLIITAGEGLANKQINENGQNIQDPHVWLDPILAKTEVERIEKGFEKIDPKDSIYFQNNASKLYRQLDGLDLEYKTGLKSCQKKDFITSHAAFGYLSAQYGINQIPISGVSPDQEPSAQTLAKISDLIKKEDIKIVFFESLVSPKLSQTIAAETGAKTMVLDPIEGISDNDLNKGQNYLTVMKSNLAALQTALECK
ncbi:MAG TPA: zinc ABC transporter substrate-binding protein [Candidatus Sulfotelmatobacter sp.]|nr:zinc ABC transporter substrate-binding protein [Candidatus Sulfotelmatobacter sp.]